MNSSQRLDSRLDSPIVKDRLNWLNSLPEHEANKAIMNCCGSAAWCDAMVHQRPFRNMQHLIESARQASESLTGDDWRQAFGAHLRIGEKKVIASQQAQRWSEREQTGAATASGDTQLRLQQANEEYYGRFGYIFIVCATGKSAEEMLAILERRLHNDAETELNIAAEEQRKITELRLKKLVSE